MEAVIAKLMPGDEIQSCGIPGCEERAAYHLVKMRDDNTEEEKRFLRVTWRRIRQARPSCNFREYLSTLAHALRKCPHAGSKHRSQEFCRIAPSIEGLPSSIIPLSKALWGGHRQKIFLMTRFDGRTKKAAALQTFFATGGAVEALAVEALTL